MNTHAKIVMSTATVAAALGALSVGAANKSYLTPKTTGSFDGIAKDAVGSGKVQSIIRNQFYDVARTIVIDADLVGSIYLEVAFGGDGGGGGVGDGGASDGNENPRDGQYVCTGAGEGEVCTWVPNPPPTDNTPPPPPPIQYDENGIPLGMVEQLDALQGNDGFDESQINTETDIISALGLQVPEGMTQQEYLMLLDNIYAELINRQIITNPQPTGTNPLNGVFTVDSTNTTGLFGCYGNCHQACHGSRGWR